MAVGPPQQILLLSCVWIVSGNVIHMCTVPSYLPRNRAHVPSYQPCDLSVAQPIHIIFPYTTAFFYAKMMVVHIVPSWCFGCVVTPFYHWGPYELFLFP